MFITDELHNITPVLQNFDKKVLKQKKKKKKKKIFFWKKSTRKSGRMHI